MPVRDTCPDAARLQARVPGDSWTRCRHGAHSSMKPSRSCWESCQPPGLCVPPPGLCQRSCTWDPRAGLPAWGSGLSTGLWDTSPRLELTGPLGEPLSLSSQILGSSSWLCPGRGWAPTPP
ncbi:hypothetical protein VULLAG_LOCUS10628 [Vulpes lagopus]